MPTNIAYDSCSPFGFKGHREEIKKERENNAPVMAVVK